MTTRLATNDSVDAAWERLFDAVDHHVHDAISGHRALIEAAVIERERTRIKVGVRELRTVPNARMGSGTRTDYFEGWLDAVAAVVALAERMP